VAAKRSARQCNSVKPLSQHVFETLSRRIHDANVVDCEVARLVRCRSLGEFLAAILTTQTTGKRINRKALFRSSTKVVSHRHFMM